MFRLAVEDLNKKATVTCVSDGNEALKKIKSQDYDVIIIDLENSGMEIGGLLKRITMEIPKALILVTAQSSSVSDGLCAEAMAKGAFDYFIKPIYNSYIENFNLAKQKISDIFGIIYQECSIDTKPETGPAVKKGAHSNNKLQLNIALIAVSTGGPLAMENIFSKLSKDFPIPILAIQHIPPQFTDQLAYFLNQKSQLTIKVAEHMEQIKAGTVYIAPGGAHMMLNSKYVIHMSDSPPINGIRPAADVLFESVADSFSDIGVLAVILTGMGNDGEKGLACLKKKLGCICLAQSEKTCVVYGMPRAAVESGFADKILDLDEISVEMENLVANNT